MTRGRRGARSDASGPRRHTPPGRIGWRRAGRLVDAGGAGRGDTAILARTEDLHTLLALASAPPAVSRADAAQLGKVLAAFRDAADSPPPPDRITAPRRRAASRSFAVQCVAAMLTVGAGVTAASAGILPAPIQRLAHHLLGGVGVPAPFDGASSPSARTIASQSPHSSATATNAPTATPAAKDVVALCNLIGHGAKNWSDGLDAESRAILSTAARGDGNVTAYCAQLLTEIDAGSSAGTSPSAGASPSASGSAGASASPAATSASVSSPNPSASKSHGNPHPSKTPNPHSTGH